MHETRCNGTHNSGHERDTDATATRQRSNKEQRQPQANAVAVALVAHAHIKCVIDQFIDWFDCLVGWCCKRSLSQWQCGKMSPRGNNIEASLIVKGTRRSRTRARSESSTLPTTHRPAIESSSSSRWLASSMMEHIDDDPRAM